MRLGGACARRLISWFDRLAAAGLVLLLVCQLFVGVLPRTGELRVTRELTGSMRPTIPVGAMILYRPMSGDALKRREIISFHRSGAALTTTHRVVSVRREGATMLVRTRGDANNVDDRQTITFGAHQTVWRASAVLPPWVASVVFDLVNRGWRLMLCLLPLTLLLTWLGSRIPDTARRPRRRIRGTWARSTR